MNSRVHDGEVSDSISHDVKSSYMFISGRPISPDGLASRPEWSTLAGKDSILGHVKCCKAWTWMTHWLNKDTMEGVPLFHLRHMHVSSKERPEIDFDRVDVT